MTDHHAFCSRSANQRGGSIGGDSEVSLLWWLRGLVGQSCRGGRCFGLGLGWCDGVGVLAFISVVGVGIGVCNVHGMEF